MVTQILWSIVYNLYIILSLGLLFILLWKILITFIGSNQG